MSKNLLAMIGITTIIAVIIIAVTTGVEKGTTLFQAVGAVFVFIALSMFFLKKEEK